MIQIDEVYFEGFSTYQSFEFWILREKKGQVVQKNNMGEYKSCFKFTRAHNLS